MDKYSSAPDSVCTTYVKKILVIMFAWSLFMLRGVLCAMICPLILTHDPYRGPIGNLKNLGRHSKCGAERCNSIWRPRWPPHPCTQYNSIRTCLGVINLAFLPRFWGLKNPLKSFSGLKKVAGKGEFQDGRQNGEK